MHQNEIDLINGRVTEEELEERMNQEKHPEFNDLIMLISDTACFMINKRAESIKSDEVKYKQQYVLEEVIKVLQARV
ncbi:MAG: hypothetical protein WC755_09790 [Candidatus Woesearchaeota archaeon]|jgi:hypothetical protein